MATLNKVQLIGNVGSIETKIVKENVTVTTISLCTNKKDKSSWHHVTCWRSLAEIAEKIVSKGDLLFIEGELNYTSYTAQGEERKSVQIIANDVQLLSVRKDKEQ